MNTSKFLLIGDNNSGMAALQTMLRQGGIWVECLEGIEVKNATKILAKFLQNRSQHTIVLIVVPITLRVPAVNWLNWLKDQANSLTLSSLNFFRNAMIVFTHADEISQTLDEGILRQILRQKCEEFDS
ncbi:hypothetical protein LOD99_9494 [Oopsacas minuta]|uniref:Uncharacterized protein n=1 Tax=Oopsacas minuta TaxID=111878 RepID=A0AAV7JBP8_9METZ|nr:hypothetical protein LOD99_9494 [Oopsacas minuta]